MRTAFLTRPTPFTVLVLLLAACGATAGDSAATTLTQSTSTTQQTTTTTAATTTTTTPATTTAPEIDVEPMVLLAFGDSILAYPTREKGAIGIYAGMLEEEFGIPVEVRLRAAFGSSPTDLLNSLGSERNQADLAEADVIVLEIPMGDVAKPWPIATGYQGRDPADCGGEDHQQCLRDYLTEHNATVEAILFAITGTSDPSETLIRALDCYQMHIEDQIANGGLPITNPYWQQAQDFLEETAALYGIPTAQVYDEFMGPDHTDDPQERGLVMADQRHPTAAGAQLIAEMIRDLGFDLAN